MSAAMPPPNPYSAPVPYPQGPPPQNTLGLVGFILSLLGFVCALGFPIGLILSLMGLRKEPKVFAIIGTVIGGFGTLMIVVVLIAYGTMIAACVGIGAAMQPQIQTQQALRDARNKIQNHKWDKGSYPNQAEGDALIQGVNDYWKKQVRYEPKNDGYTIRSAGPDGQFDTPDDLKVDENEMDLDVDVGKPTEEFKMPPETPESPPAVPEPEKARDTPGEPAPDGEPTPPQS